MSRYIITKGKRKATRKGKTQQRTCSRRRDPQPSSAPQCRPSECVVVSFSFNKSVKSRDFENSTFCSCMPTSVTSNVWTGPTIVCYTVGVAPPCFLIRILSTTASPNLLHYRTTFHVS